jgi:nitroreductase
MKGEDMSKLTECIEGRRSIRNFKEEKLKDEDILDIIESATFAPSAINKQPWYFIVITDDALKKQMANVVETKLKEVLGKTAKDEDINTLVNYTNFFTFFEGAPVVIAVLCRPITSPLALFLERTGIPVDELEDPVHSEIQSASAAIQNMLLKAHELGLGACWMTNPLIAEKELESLLQVKKPWYIMCIIPIGVPASTPHMPRRKKIASIVKFVNGGF